MGVAVRSLESKVDPTRQAMPAKPSAQPKGLPSLLCLFLYLLPTEF